MEIRNTLGLFAPLALLAQAPAATAQDTPIVLEPSSQWVVDFQADRCIVMRAFGEGDQKTVLQFSQFIPLDGIGLTLSGRLAKVKQVIAENFDPTNVLMQFDPLPEKAYADVNIGKTANGDPVLLAFQIMRGAPVDEDAPTDITNRPKALNAEAGFASDVQGISFTGRIRQPFTLKTGPLDKLFGVMRQCTDDLAKGWGLDPVALRSAQRGPKATEDSREKVGKAFQELSFRRVSRSQRASAVNARLLVDAEGKVSGCEPLSVTRSENFDQKICELASRMRYEPALDREGKPMPSVTLFTFAYYVS